MCLICASVNRNAPVKFKPFVSKLQDEILPGFIVKAKIMQALEKRNSLVKEINVGISWTDMCRYLIPVCVC